MTRSRIILIATIAAAISACAGSDATGPTSNSVRPSTASYTVNGDLHDGLLIPGSVGNAGSTPNPAQQQRLACNITAPLYGSATIGAEGGVLFVGKNMLIVPPGALSTNVQISGSVAAGNEFQIDFQPHGLQFRKPAGLILDASACAGAPNGVYLDEQGGIAERITASFSTWWHTIAAPLDHFSTYALDG